MKQTLLIAAWLLATLAHAQVSMVGGTPYSFDNSADIASLTDLPLIEMPAVDVETLLAEDALVTDKREAYRFGQEFDVNLSPITDGLLELLPDGSRLYRLPIKCKKAISINLVYNHFHLPPGARLYLYNPQQTDVLGAFTDYNNKPYLQFSTGLVRGDITILEYYEPANAAFPGIINISKVVHGYRGLRTPEKGYGDSGSCNNNVNCPEATGWENEIRSVAMIIEGGFRACTGAVINNIRQDCTPYFLTANHCLGGSFATWLFMFNYESPTCTNQDGPTNQTVSGCTLRATDEPSDFALLELSELPPPEYNVYYAGWSAVEAAATSSTCIHHPSGDIKKITFNTDLLVSDNWDSTPDTHWKVSEWEDGTTEPGSSGSPMFDPDHRIVGQLHGGGAACGNSDYDTFGKVAYSWDEGNNAATRLQDWLDPDNTGILSIDGRSCSEAQFALDAAIVLQGIPAALCNQSSVSPQVLLRNNGSESLTAATITLTVDATPQTPIAWTGNLAYLQAVIINLPSLNLAEGLHPISVSVASPNGGTDQNNTNNQDNANVQIVVAPELEVTVETDFYPDETSFEISNEQGQVVYAQIDGFNASTNNEFIICLPVGCYTFTIYDSYGDGIDNGGGFSLSVNGIELASFYDEFTTSAEADFCVQPFANEVSADFTANQTDICKGQQVQFNAAYTSPTASYQWTFDGGSPATSNSPSPSITYNSSGTYGVTLQVTDGGTPVQQTQSSFISVGIEVSVAVTDAANPISTDGSAAVTASFGTPPYTYNWSNGAGSITSQNNLVSGLYAVTVTDSQNCSDIAEFSIGSIIAPMQLTNFTADHLTICVGETVVFTPTTATPPNTYDWVISNGVQSYQSNDPTPAITFTEIGTYSVTCSISDAFSTDELVKTAYITVIAAPQVTATLTQPDLNSLLVPNGAITLTVAGVEPFSYAWSVPDSGNTNALNGLGEGAYAVTVTDAVGCQTIISQILSIEVSDPSGILFYPTPSVGMPNIYNTHTADERVLLELFDVAGRLIGVYDLQNGNNNLHLYLASGIYIARVWAGNLVLKTEKLRIL